MKLFLMMLFALGTGSLAAGSLAQVAPNILFVVVDDLGAHDVQLSPDDTVCRFPTPNIRAFAEQGMVFEHAYAANAVCSPTRASLMTGKSPAALRLTEHIPANPPASARRVPSDSVMLPAETADRLDPAETTFAELLKKDGYHTAYIGKWHLSGEGSLLQPDRQGVLLSECQPDAQGFDVNIGGCAYGAPPSYFSPYRNATIPDGSDGEYLTDRLTAEAVRLINEFSEKPFLICLNYYSVHRPHQAKPELVDSKFGELADYAAMVASVDENMGRLLRALDDAGLAADTLVVFTSDNGGLEGNTPLRGKKGELWEGGTRVPLMIRWPGVVAAGITCDEPVISYDFLPTLLDAAGSGEAPPAEVEGVSLLPLLKGKGGFVRTEPLYWHYPHFHHDGGPMGSSIRASNWKLIFPYETGRPLLFDLSADPSEQKNVAARFPEKTEQLKTQLLRKLQRVNAAMPVKRTLK